MMMIMMLSKEYEMVVVVIWVRGGSEYTLKEPQKWILNFFCAAQIFLMFS